MRTNELEGQKALVTGATAGIGRAIAVKLAQAGATVHIVGRRAELGKETLRLAEQAGGEAHLILADLADLENVRGLAADVGDVDVLVNNAGIYPFSPTPEQSPESYEQVFGINVRAAYFLTAALAPAMVARKRGSIVNVSSVAGQVGPAGTSVYSASKAAMDALTRSWAAEFGAAGVRVNSVAPGPIRTDNAVREVGEAFEGFSASTLLGRAGEPEEIAEAVLFLASSRSSYITGAVLNADGGYVAV
ncbi:SDR family NAD(P)-dependent oxidoreductase [Kibdelosporangium aridum]|uniref:SDR family NAD(P)-dependent oxidoreductase n=1 Tax=Kibdelosporangium aridum TaxID=2030 RepID=A0A428ZIV8_KIBAR|nr:SDR family oxidoreductase [Kibdelosporangium aridum]RSM87900.1 SDR family NAD(P)-dependent oxidoreductase [Kibdelosporangium aridum]